MGEDILNSYFFVNMSFGESIEQIAVDGKFFKAAEGSNTIRIVSSDVPVWKAFGPDGSCKVFVTQKAAMEFNKTEPNEAYQAKGKGSVYIINRKNGMIQIAEFGTMILKAIKALSVTPTYEFNDVPPYDMIINKKVEGGKTSYTVVAARSNTELTKEEKDQVSALEPLLHVWMKEAVDADKVANNLAAPSA